MRVLAFDPGYDRLGVAVVDHTDGTDTFVYSACFTTGRNTPLNERLYQIGEEVARLLATYTPDHVALETLFFNKNQKTAIAVAEVRGIILYLAQRSGCSLGEFSPQAIKIAVTGYGKSDKEAVILMVKRLLRGVPAHALDDEYDAIAVGMTAIAHARGR